MPEKFEACHFCGSTDVEVSSSLKSRVFTVSVRCRACGVSTGEVSATYPQEGNHYEAIQRSFDEAAKLWNAGAL